MPKPSGERLIGKGFAMWSGIDGLARLSQGLMLAAFVFGVLGSAAMAARYFVDRKLNELKSDAAQHAANRLESERSATQAEMKLQLAAAETRALRAQEQAAAAEHKAEASERERVAILRYPVDRIIARMKTRPPAAPGIGPIFGPLEDGAGELLWALRKEPALIPFVIEAYESSVDDSALAVPLLFTLYYSTNRDGHWRRRITQKLSQAPEDLRYWGWVFQFEWDQRDTPMLESIVPIVTGRAVPALAKRGLMRAIASFRGNLEARAFTHKGGYFDLLELCRDEALNLTRDGEDRRKAVFAAARLNLEAFVVISVVILMSPSESFLARNVALALMNPALTVERARLGLDISGFGVIQPIFGTPKLTDARRLAEEWAAAHGDLMTKWTEQHLTEIRRLPDHQLSPGGNVGGVIVG